MIRRAPRAERYTVVPNAVLEDERLSFKAMGLLVYLLSKPDYWTVSREHLATTHDDGLTSIRSALAELRKAGYLTRHLEKDGAGRIIGHYTIVHEAPAEQIEIDFPDDDEDPPADPPKGGEPYGLKTRPVERDPLVSTERSSPLSEASTERETPRARSGSGLTVGFDAFAAVFPNKAGPRAARQAWHHATRRAAPADILLGAMRYRDDPHREDRYTKQAAKWLDGDHWLDPPLPAPPRRRRRGQPTNDQLQRHLALLETDPFFAEANPP